MQHFYLYVERLATNTSLSSMAYHLSWRVLCWRNPSTGPLRRNCPGKYDLDYASRFYNQKIFDFHRQDVQLDQLKRN
ncbi:hypothetical protein [Algoriphagus jejuensis]|uniref:hypothetical protein n=1 Tax=Algoriphagus jejuensis TaxID=419934 RepID=UPI0031D611D0